MTHSIRIIAGTVSVNADLNDSSSAETILKALLIQASANTWGDEIYFSIPVEQQLSDDARADMQMGELGYWPLVRSTRLAVWWTTSGH